MHKKDKKILYTGLDPSRYKHEGTLVHCPFIAIQPCNVEKKEVVAAFSQFDRFTHVVFTSRSSASIWLGMCQEKSIGKEIWKEKTIIAIGRATKSLLEEKGLAPNYTACPETAEGMVEILKTLDLKEAHLFLPHSSLSRPLLRQFMKEQCITHTSCVLYETHFCCPQELPDLSMFDEIVFTSPSTVEAFCHCYGSFPNHARLTSIGPITAKKIISKKKEVSYRGS